MRSPRRSILSAAPAGEQPATARRPAVAAAPTPRSAVAVAAGRTAAVAGVLVLTALASAPPAAALNRDDGDDPGAGLSILETVGLYVGIPLLLFALTALYVYGPSSARGPRYRPGVGWWAQPVWFTGEGRGSAQAPGGRTAPASPATSTGTDRIAPAATGVTRSETSVMSSGLPASSVTDAPSGGSSLGDQGGGGIHAGHDASTRTSPEGGASARW